MVTGAMLGGLGINRWGRQPILLVAFIVSIAGVFLQFFSSNVQQFLGGKIAFIFTAILGLSTIFIFFAVPETKDRTHIEIDALWQQGVPPRKFKETNLVTITDDVEGEKSGAKVEHVS